MKNLRPFLDMIAHSEIGPAMLAASDNGYNVLVGSRPSKMSLFTGYADHPRIRVDLGRGLVSTAAGRYQILARYFDPYKELLHLPDFSPPSQDAIATQMIKERGAVLALEAGDFEEAVWRCRKTWASLPGAGYAQHENDLKALRVAYVDAGGTIGATPV
jgi:muramidase (phage lysozyme)